MRDLRNLDLNLLKAFEALMDEQSVTKTAERTVSIAARDYAFRAILLPFLTALHQRAPKIKMSAVPINDLQVRQLLSRGQLDLALVTPEDAAPDLHQRNLYEEEYICVLRADHSLATVFPA